MNNDNPLVPQGSLLEQKTKSRSRVKTAFFCVLAVHVLAILTALIAQGCKREQPPVMDDTRAPLPTFEPTNVAPVVESNVPPPVAETNALPPIVDTPVPTPTPTPTPPPPYGVGTEYVVAKGDSFYSIGKKLGVSMKAIAAANPGVDSAKLKIGQKLQVPAGAAPAAGSVAPAVEGGVVSEQSYTVKSGDNLTKIASKHGITVKALRSANNLKTDRIKVGDKLVIPVKASAPAPAPVAPSVVPEPTPAVLPVPSSSPAPAPSGMPPR